jgi:hypothetical protein
VKRECYSLIAVEGQTEQSSCIVGCGVTELEGCLTSRRGDPGEGVRHPGGLVALAAKRHRCQVRRIRFHEQPIARHETQEIVVRPLPEGHDPRERDVPPRIDREFGEGLGAGITVKDSGYTGSARVMDDRAGIVLGFTRVDNDGLPHLGGERDLRGERSSLELAGRIVVVIVEAAFPDGDRARGNHRTKVRNVAGGIECRGIVRMDPGGGEDEPGILTREPGGHPRRRKRLTDADDRRRARDAGAEDYLAAVAVERRVREVGVAVDED